MSTTKTRPAEFTWTPRPGTCTTDACRNRVYRITEPSSINVLDASTGQNPGRDRRRVVATVDEEYPQWVVWTKGYSDHGNSSTRRTFDTLEEAERYIRNWATRRWRVAIDANENTFDHFLTSLSDRGLSGLSSFRAGRCTFEATAQGWTMSGPSGVVTMDAEQFDADRALAHWHGFCQVNGVPTPNASRAPIRDTAGLEAWMKGEQA